jgi:mono/diheme cytochrome c family protein
VSASQPANAPRWIALAAALMLGAALPVCAADDNARDNEGQVLFNAQCADCHGPRDIAHWAERYPDAEERRAWMERLLERHYPPAEAERPLIIEHIEQLIAEADDGG